MKTIEEELGKVSITCNGQWTIDKSYERLCMVHDGFYASYISRKYTPAGTSLSDEEFWQPVASLKGDLVIDYETFKKEIIELVAVVQRGLKAARIVVADMESRDALTWERIAVGCEVYVIETKKSYILDEITPVSNAKKWHLEADSEIGSQFVDKLSGMFPRAIAERAVADEFGINIQDNYLRREVVVNYMANVLKQYFVDNSVQILKGQITPDMLSETVKQMFVAAKISNAADEEDLTVVDNLLKFADKEYNVNNYSGKARKFLRKNMIGGVNILTQEMINEPNTIYILQYDYCLNNETIELPDDSIIIWKGGMLYEGAIKLNKCRLLSCYRQEDMFDKNSIILDGDWAVGQILYHPLDLGEDNKQVEIVGWGGNYTNDYYWFWDGEKWVSLGFDLSVYLTRDEFEAFREKLREEMEKFYVWLLAQLQAINNRLDAIDSEIDSIHGDINNINNNISNLEQDINNKLGDINNIINDMSNSIGDSISNLEQYINNKIQEILNNIDSSGDNITNEYRQYFDENFLSMFKKYIKEGTNITFVENTDGTITINSTGGGGEGGGEGGLTEAEVRVIVSGMLNDYYTKSEIDEIIAGLQPTDPSTGQQVHNIMTTTQLGEARTGKYLVMSKYTETETKPSRLDVDFNLLYSDIKNKLTSDGFGQGGGGNQGGGLDASTVQGWIAAAVPKGSIMLWDSNEIPAGWEIYTAAQGRYVMSYKPNGINALHSANSANTITPTQVLNSVGSTYGSTGNASDYYISFTGSQIPKHQHVVSMGWGRSGDDNHDVVQPAGWSGFGSVSDGNFANFKNVSPNATRVNGGTRSNLHLDPSKANYATGPNLSFTTASKRSFSETDTQDKDVLYLNKLLPTIALHYIKKVKHPWE